MTYCRKTKPPLEVMIWTNYPDLFIQHIGMLVKKKFNGEVYTHKSLLKFLATTDEEILDFKENKLPSISWLVQLAKSKEGIEILDFFNKLHAEDLKKKEFSPPEKRNGKKVTEKISSSFNSKKGIKPSQGGNDYSEKINIEKYLEFLRSFYEQKEGIMSEQDFILAIPCPKARDKFLAGFQFRTGCLDGRSFDILVGPESIKEFRKTGTVPLAWQKIIDDFGDGADFKRIHTQSIPISSLRNGATNPMPPTKPINQSLKNRGRKMKKLKVIAVSKERVKSGNVIEKIIDLGLKNQNELVSIVGVTSGIITFMKQGKRCIYEDEMNIIIRHFNMTKKDFYKAIGIEDLCTDGQNNFSVDDPADSNAKSTKSTQSPATNKKIHSESASHSDKKQEFSKNELTKIDMAIHQSLLKAGKAPDDFSRASFFDSLIEKLPDICIIFLGAEKKIYFQKENRQTSFSFAHLKFQ